MILATPLIEKLHHNFPDGRIDFLLKKGNEGLFKDHPELNLIIAWDKKHNKYRNLFNIIRNIRKEKYDYLINIQRFASSGIITFLSGAKTTIGFDKNPLSVFFNNKIKHEIGNEQVHEIDRNLKLVENITNKENFTVKLYPSENDFAKVSTYKNRKYICLAPASLWYTKQYPEDKWVDFIRQAGDNYIIYLLGSYSDNQLCSNILMAADMPNVFNLAGKLSLLETAALMKDAHMNYVNDSAPMHLASAMNAPVTAIFCSTVSKFGFGPLSDNSAIVETSENLECRPCGLHGLKACPEKHFKCAWSIKTEQLLERL